MNLFQLECFLSVATHLNFARAAEQLHVTQPTVSHQIQSLERELGVSLFRRSTRTVELTMEGQIFLLDAKGIVAQSHMAIQRFVHKDQAQMVPLSLGCDGLMGLPIPTGVLVRLRQQFPGLHPRIVSLADALLFRQLEEGALDIVIAPQNESRGKFTYREIGIASILCVLPEDHPLAQRNTLTLEELAEEPLILYEPEALGSEAGMYQLQLAQGRKPSALNFCSSHQTAAFLTASGFGVSFLPDTFSASLANYALRTVPLAGFPPLSYGIYYKSPVEKPQVRAFLREMEKG